MSPCSCNLSVSSGHNGLERRRARLGPRLGQQSGECKSLRPGWVTHTEREKISKSSVLSHNGTDCTARRLSWPQTSDTNKAFLSHGPLSQLVISRVRRRFLSSVLAPGKLCIPLLVVVRVNHECVFRMIICLSSLLLETLGGGGLMVVTPAWLPSQSLCGPQHHNIIREQIPGLGDLVKW